MSDGLLLLRKPVGESSFKALYPVKRIFRGHKIGHAGTLDPAASGLLVVGVGMGTRLLEFLEAMPKSYRFEVRLGIETDTYDLEGAVVAQRDASGITRAQVEEILPRFRGRIQQLPPAYSALKIQGKRACDRARAGETVELAPREVRIDRLEMLDFAEGVATLEMDCSKGTYVRAIAHDIGKALGCGAAAQNIQRTRIGPFLLEQALAPEALQGPSDLLPLDKAVEHMPAVQLRPNWVGAMLNGNPIPAAGYTPIARPVVAFSGGEPLDENSPMGVFSPVGKLMAIGTVNSLGLLNPRKVLPQTR